MLLYVYAHCILEMREEGTKQMEWSCDDNSGIKIQDLAQNYI